MTSVSITAIFVFDSHPCDKFVSDLEQVCGFLWVNPNPNMEIRIFFFFKESNSSIGMIKKKNV
jgi:hypothetical protein